jgi:hypothetical protein
MIGSRSLDLSYQVDDFKRQTYKKGGFDPTVHLLHVVHVRRYHRPIAMTFALRISKLTHDKGMTYLMMSLVKARQGHRRGRSLQAILLRREAPRMSYQPKQNVSRNPLSLRARVMYHKYLQVSTDVAQVPFPGTAVICNLETGFVCLSIIGTVCCLCLHRGFAGYHNMLYVICRESPIYVSLY